MVRTTPNATTLLRHRLKISIQMRRTAGHPLPVAKAGAILLGKRAGRTAVAKEAVKEVERPLCNPTPPLFRDSLVTAAVKEVERPL